MEKLYSSKLERMSEDEKKAIILSSSSAEERLKFISKIIEVYTEADVSYEAMNEVYETIHWIASGGKQGKVWIDLDICWECL